MSPDTLQWYSMDDIDDLLDEAEKVCNVGKAKKITSSEVNDHVSRYVDDILTSMNITYTHIIYQTT